VTIASRSTDAEPRAGGRPRDPALDRAILDATLALLEEEGFERMSIEQVAQRAGVGKPTIYRRWASKHELVIDAVKRLADPLDVPAAGTVRARVTSVIERLWARASRARSDKTALVSNLIGAMHRDAELGDAVRAAFVADRRRDLIALLREGVSAGEIRPDVDLEVAADVLLSPLMSRKLLSGGRIAPSVGRAVVDLLFDGCGPRD
jgi:AcrR family transcriptional regulator